jgi:hypothetical protein
MPIPGSPQAGLPDPGGWSAPLVPAGRLDNIGALQGESGPGKDAGWVGASIDAELAGLETEGLVHPAFGVADGEAGDAGKEISEAAGKADQDGGCGLVLGWRLGPAGMMPGGAATHAGHTGPVIAAVLYPPGWRRDPAGPALGPAAGGTRRSRPYARAG